MVKPILSSWGTETVTSKPSPSVQKGRQGSISVTVMRGVAFFMVRFSCSGGLLGAQPKLLMPGGLWRSSVR